MKKTRREMDPDRLKKRLLEAVSSFPGKRVLVVGDVMLDQFVWGEVSRISPEAPVPVVQVEKESFLLGGAANVANNLRSLDASPALSGVIGKDAFGEKIVQLCNKKGIRTSAMVTDPERPTTLKTRIVARGQQVVRVDREEADALSDKVVSTLKAHLKDDLDDSHAVIISDYNKGVVCRDIMEFLVDHSGRNTVPCLVDPKPVNADLYRGATVITPNEKEAEAISSLSIKGDKALEKAAKAIAQELSLQIVLITRGPEGMALWQKDKGLFTIPTMAREVFDVTGAGDTVISLMALGITSGLSPCESAFLANLAAGIVVGKVGTATVTRAELETAIRRAPVESFVH